MLNEEMRKLTEKEIESISGGEIVIQSELVGIGYIEDYKVIDDITGESFGPYKDYRTAKNVNEKINVKIRLEN